MMYLKMLEYENLDLEQQMAVRVAIKLGGGLISDKSSMKKFNPDAVERVVDAIFPISELGVSIILVHGAGSFGHLLAKKWKIAEGMKTEISKDQREAVEEIRSDMRELNELIIDKFTERGLACIGHPPSEWAIGTGARFMGDISVFERAPGEPIPVTFGDVVETDDEREFGILSGDDLMFRLSTELDVTHSIFLIGDADGVMSRPPSEEGSELITHLRSELEMEGVHDADIDVTGGIRLKIERALEISKEVDEVWIIDGRKPNRILELLTSGQTKGTKILHG
jgi:isopentenyl phosphate kinase